MKEKPKQNTVYNGHIQDTESSVKSDTIDNNSIATERFINLVKFVDSSGFTFDTTRFNETYSGWLGSSKNTTIHVVENYVFYETPLKATLPFWHNERVENITDKSRNEWREKWSLNFERFEKTERITGYFFTQKKPISVNGVNFSIDGIIEEWKFSNQHEAMEMAEDLARTEKMVYVNRGAFVCYIDRYVYVFHSRSADFYSTQKLFFEYLINQYNAIVPKK